MSEYKCERCEKFFSEARSLHRHIQPIHEGHKDHKCEPCGTSFTQSQNLKTHIHTVHEGHKDFKCEFCGNSFSTRGNLKENINVLPIYQCKSKIFKCETCKEKFSSGAYSKQHKVNIHEGQKDHKCDCEFCNESTFSQTKNSDFGNFIYCENLLHFYVPE